MKYCGFCYHDELRHINSIGECQFCQCPQFEEPTEKKMPRLPEFIAHLDKSRTIHEKKNEDYASANDPLDNFDRSNSVASWFLDAKYKSYTVLIGTKLARLATLLNSTKEPNNESIDDTFLDLLTYVNLWWCAYERRTALRTETASHAISPGEKTRVYGSGQSETGGNRDITCEDMELGSRITEALKGTHITDREEALNGAFARIVLTIAEVRRGQGKSE